MTQKSKNSVLITQHSALKSSPQSHETSLMFSGQRPQEGANVGALEEEADGVDAHLRLAGESRVEHVLEPVAQVLAQDFGFLGFRPVACLRRQDGAGVGQAVGKNVDRVEPLRTKAECFLES